MKKVKWLAVCSSIVLCLILSLSVPVIVSADESDTASIFLDAQQSDQHVIVNINVSSDSSIASIQYTLKYDSSLFNVESAVLQGKYQNMMNAINTQRVGEIIFAAAGTKGTAEDGVVMRVTFSVKEDKKTQTAAFSLVDALIGDESGNILLEEGSAYVQLESDSDPSGSETKPGGENDSGQSDPTIDHSEANEDGDNIKNPNSDVNIFNDINGHWAYDFIINAYRHDLMVGYGNGTFGPNDSITRAQMAVVLWNSAGNPKPSGESPFTDLEKDWYRDAVIWAAEQGLVQGEGNGCYNPEGTLTREHLAQILFNRAGQVQGMETVLTSIYDGQYTDSGQISAWAKPALYWSVYKGILCGTDSLLLNDRLSPKSPASRAQIAVMLTRCQ